MSTTASGPRAPAAPFTAIPVVDLSGAYPGTAAEATLAPHVLDACHRVGFFLLVGHDVPERLPERLFAAMDAFFSLPEAVRATIDKANSRHFRGWERVGSELTDNRTDFREQLDISSEHPPYPPDIDPPYLRLDGPNQWLPEAVLPGFRAVVAELFSTMSDLAQRLMRLLSLGLGLEGDHLERLFGARPHSLAKLINYPPTPPGEAGVNAHHDAGFLTLLLQDDVGGLQALNPDGAWIDVPPVPGAFVVNTGEMLQEITGNYVVATNHRVITGLARRSAAYFHGPDLRTALAPLPLAPAFAEAVAASPSHAQARFMAPRTELLAGADGISSARGAGVYGQQLWNYYLRSYPANVRRHYPDLADLP